MIQIMTTEEYAKTVKGCSQQAVRKAITQNKLHRLIGVKEVTKSGKYHILHVEVAAHQA